MADQELRALWAELDTDLRALRPMFEQSPDGVRAPNWFDEYLSANELGLALETLCDYLLEADLLDVPRHVLREIERLHARMGVQDNCANNLHQKYAQ